MIIMQTDYHTDMGDIRETNQDAIFCKTGIFHNHTVGLFIVADGCGGMAYGDVISKLAVSNFSRFWEIDLPESLISAKTDEKSLDKLLECTIENINNRAIEFSKDVNMKVGTTLSVLLIVDKKYYIKNIGDSRIYLFRGKRARQITDDQSLLAEMVRGGSITAEEAESSKQKNVLTMCIGVFNKIYTNSHYGHIRNNDLFLVCSDGLYNCLDLNTIRNIIVNRKIKLEDKCDYIRDLIAYGNAVDNVSMVICKIKKRPWIL